MNELEKRINSICRKTSKLLDPSEYQLVIIKEFISKCSLSEFEKLKDLEYDLNQKDNE